MARPDRDAASTRPPRHQSPHAPNRKARAIEQAGLADHLQGERVSPEVGDRQARSLEEGSGCAERAPGNVRGSSRCTADQSCRACSTQAGAGPVMDEGADEKAGEALA